MKKRPKRIPDTVRAAIWYADPKVVDWEENKEELIASLLSRGSFKAVRWAFHFYGARKIRNVIAHPQRGLWFPEALHFWSQFFNLSIDPQTYQKAIAGVLPPRK